jgi:exopolysaccharide/PEP-CTERM locus tyrosine autokinase
VSLIESALQKLRRAGEGSAEHGAVVPRATTLATVAPMGRVGVVATEAHPEGPVRLFTVDLKALRGAGYLPEERLERRFADDFRRIKRPLIEKALNGSPDMRLIMVSSALPGDGKTFTAINLAFSMANERDVSVLLVDADPVRARVTTVFGLGGEPGLLDALASPSLDVESLIQHTNVRGLEILAAGQYVENATELLASARMGEIAEYISVRNSRRLVLFDCSPLLVSSEARVMMRIAGQIVLVARSGLTPRQAVVDAVAQIDKNKLRGLVLNHSPHRPEGGYDYYYDRSGSDPRRGQ